MSAGTTQKYGTIVTNRGRQIIAGAVSTNTTVDIKYVALGDGGGEEYYPSSSQANLKNQVYEAEATNVYQDETNQSWIVIQLYVPEDIGGWWIRELAVKTVSGEVLAIGTVAPSYKPMLDQGTASGTYYRIFLEVSNATVVNLTVDPSTVMASQADVEKIVSGHARLTNAHGGTYEKTPSRLMLRNAKGQCQVAEPEYDDDATPKRWTEDKIATLKNEVDTSFDELIAGTIFTGMVVMFNGVFSGKHPLNPATNQAVSKWHICDGTDGTPDLRDKFVLGVSDTISIGQEGGSKTHKHKGNTSGTVGATTLSIAQLPPHSFEYVTYNSTARVGDGQGTNGGWFNTNTRETEPVGDGQPHTHPASDIEVDIDSGGELPPYYAMAFIIRTA